MESQQPIVRPESSLAPANGGERTVELLHLFDKMKAIRVFIFDVDGVFTDNSLLVTEAGELLRIMNVRDGQAVKWTLRKGFPVCIITGGRSEGVHKRMTGLGITEIYSGVEDKREVFTALLKRLNVRSEEVCYMGDDLPDLPVLRRVGLSCAPADASPEVLAEVDFVSPLKGGHGCVRDLLERVLKVQDQWVEF
ncbi:MAG: HAD-IIIA family hydrolase [Saprospiraceae bacterium]|nr:HAD-IIIA family hydrolase [Saprospiraceae bacterium]